MTELKLLQEMSNRYGADPSYVLAGGGNTSYKTEDILYVKGSGTSLATIKAEDFVRLERAKLSAMWEKTYSMIEAERESQVLADMMAARCEGESRRPSVETLLHNLFPQKFVLHVHPALVNGLTCGKDGAAIAKKLFPRAVWVDACRPGYILASLCREKLTAYSQATGEEAELLFLQNHGVFFAADSVEAIDALVSGVMEALASYVGEVTKARRAWLGKTLCALTGATCAAFLDGEGVASFDPTLNSPTPDHIVYCKANYLSVSPNVSDEALKEQVEAFTAANGYAPRVVVVKGEGAVVLGADEKQLTTVKDVFLDQVKVYHASAAFGGYFGMSDDLVDFIVNWEVESYRAKVNAN